MSVVVPTMPVTMVVVIAVVMPLVIVVVMMVVTAMVITIAVVMVVMVVPFMTAMLVAVMVMPLVIAVVMVVMVVRTDTRAAGRRSKVNLRPPGCRNQPQTRKQERKRHAYCYGSRLESPQVWSTSGHTLATDMHNPEREESG